MQRNPGNMLQAMVLALLSTFDHTSPRRYMGRYSGPGKWSNTRTRRDGGRKRTKRAHAAAIARKRMQRESRRRNWM